MYTLNYFYRHPHAIYFSIEKLFTAIGKQVGQEYADEFTIKETFLPFPSNWKKIIPNILFAKKHRSRINHITGDISYAMLAFGKRSLNIMTVHDCVLLYQYPKTSLRYWIIKWLWYDLPVKRADAVTVISENTKKDLLHFTKCDPGKIRVIPNFVDPAFRPVPAGGTKEIPRILFIGTTPNKNLDRLIEALEGLTVHLAIIGQLSDEQTRLLKARRIDYRQSGGLTQDELIRQYVDCDLLAFPSTYEGFGLPIIEAQAIGRPVLTSELSPMREVAGEGACLVDPYDTASIRVGLLRIIQEKAYRDKLVESGSRNVGRFSLEIVGRQYGQLYTELAQQKFLSSTN